MALASCCTNLVLLLGPVSCMHIEACLRDRYVRSTYALSHVALSILPVFLVALSTFFHRRRHCLLLFTFSSFAITDQRLGPCLSTSCLSWSSTYARQQPNVRLAALQIKVVITLTT